MATELAAETHRHPAPIPYPDCYGCGSDNHVGLHLNLEFDGKKLRARFIPLEQHQGYPGIVHGGVISSLLYEVMANIQRYSGDEAVLRSSNVEFRRPVHVGELVIATARVVDETPNGWHLAAVLTNESGVRLASATGEAVRPKQSDPA
jgi:uncharacterized protein (TIGR00369 family)